MSSTKLFIATKHVSNKGPDSQYCDVEVFTDHYSAVNCAYEMAQEYCKDVARRHSGTYQVLSENGGYNVNIQVIKKSVDLPMHFGVQSADETEEQRAASL
jgi:hypothetical protein